ncbi:MAG: Uma2 family endonuclease [Ruminiclostridium sp.]|nr:Uma2 family endonuclease [Ruminiclostridium sp.]
MAMPQPNDHFTYADALTWDEDDRIELIYGEPVMMAPPSTAHQDIVVDLTAQFRTYLRDKTCRVYSAPFGVRLFQQEGEHPEDVDTLVEPDLSIVCDENKLDEAGYRGAPALIVEVLSPSNQRHDRFVKFRLYQRAGVKEYWIVDPEAKHVQVYTLEEDGQYSSAIVYGAEDKLPVGVLEGLIIDLSWVFPKDR